MKQVRMVIKGVVNINQIAQTHADLRTKEQIGFLAAYLVYKVDFFKTDSFTDQEYMMSVAERMHCHIFKQGDIIMRKGDIGDNMYISIQGKLGVYLKDNFETDPIAIIPTFKAMGERALEKPNDTRTATIIAMDEGETICLALNKEDFVDLVAVSILF